MVLIPLIFNYGINTNAMEIARFALEEGHQQSAAVRVYATNVTHIGHVTRQGVQHRAYVG